MRAEVLTVLSAPLTDIEIGATGLRSIYQNVQAIIATLRGSLFLDRTFGIAQDVVDLPTPAAMARFMSEVTLEVEKQEPRVKVVSVAFDRPDGEGVLMPKVLIQIKSGVLL